MQSHGTAIVAGGYQSLEQKPYDSLYRLFETLIDHPVRKVWPHALQIGAWMSDHRLETLAGEPGKVGHFERVFPRDLGAGVSLPHYHVYGIAEIIPYKCIGLEVLHEKGGSYGDTREKFGFDSILLVDLGSKTHFMFFMIDVHTPKRPPADDPVSRQRHEEQEQDLRARVYRYFDNLKRLVDSDGHRP